MASNDPAGGPDPYYVCDDCGHFWASPEPPDACERCGYWDLVEKPDADEAGEYSGWVTEDQRAKDLGL